MLAGVICQLPLLDRKADGNYWETPPVLDDPWPMSGRAEWVSYIVHSLIMLGDAIALPTDFDADGYARQVIPIDPRRVAIYVEGGQVWYEVTLNSGESFRLTRMDVFHAKGLMQTSDGLRGLGVVDIHRAEWGAKLALQRYGANAWSGGGVPSGIVKVHLREVSKEQAQGIKDDWMIAFADRVPAILSELMDFTPISWSPEDAQYLESAKLSVADIACMFNLDPTDLDATYGASMTYANREQRAYDRLLSSIGPLIVRIEQAFRFILPRGHSAYFDRSVLLWSDAQTRAYVQQTGITDGTLTINEARTANGLPKFDSWADKSSADPAVIKAQAELTQPKAVHINGLPGAVPTTTPPPNPAAAAQAKGVGGDNAAA
jgi:HK97 family phage portal protein